MKVVLQEDVKNVGKAGDVVSVKSGFARNFLLPRRFAVEATQKSVKAWEHIKTVAEAKKKKAVAARKELIEKLSGMTLKFQVTAGEKDKIFGTVTSHDVSHELEKQGHMVDRRDIELEPIKMLGQHQAKVNLGEGLEAELTLSVERKVD